MAVKTWWIRCFLVAFAVHATSAQASVIRCEVEASGTPAMPAWIEYEVNDRGTVAKIRDSVRVGIGIDWVTGEVVKFSKSEMILAWDEGFVPFDGESASSSRVIMRLTRRPDGSAFVSANPTDAKFLGQNFHSDAVCSG